MQIVRQRDRGRKKSLERGLVDGFRRRAPEAGVEVIVKKRAEIDLIEYVFGLGWLFQALNGGGLDRLAAVFARLRRLCERLFSTRLRELRSGGLQDGLVGVLCQTLAVGFEHRLDFFGGELFAAIRAFFEHRVTGQLLVHHLPQLEPVQLQKRDHLHQTWCQNLLLCDF